MTTLRLLCTVLVIAVVGCSTADEAPEPMTPEQKAAMEEEQRKEIGTDKVGGTREVISTVAQAVNLFRWDNNRYPTSLGELTNRPDDVAREVWRGAYYTGSGKDAWGNDLTYRMPGAGDHAYDLISWGEDGKEGGIDFAQDLTSWDGE